MSKESDEETIELVLEIVHGALEPINLWWPILDKPKRDFDRSSMLAFPIFYCCLRDLAEAPIRFFKPMLERTPNNLPDIMRSNIAEIAYQCTFALEAIRDIPTNQQIYLSLIRDRSVHGFLSGRTKSTRGIKVALELDVVTLHKKKLDIRELVKNLKGGRSDGEVIKGIHDDNIDRIRKYHKNISELNVDKSVLRHALEQNQVIYFENRSLINRHSTKNDLEIGNFRGSFPFATKT